MEVPNSKGACPLVKSNPAALQADNLHTNREIDGVVYGLYRLTGEEIKIVEGR